MSRPLTNAERLAWLRLARTPQVGPLTFHRLIARFGGPIAALEALPGVTRGRLQPAPAGDVARELERLAAMGAVLACSGEPTYPALLAALDAPPPVLSMQGRADLAERPCVALVGAREASAAGRRLAADFAAGLGAAGVTVVSGLARGVDASAHAATLDTGTIAVLAGGLDRPYPPQNLALHAEIVARGLVVSETPLGFQARAQDFPRRNRIISGLSLGVVVVEAALRSGSLITARTAGEQGRDVMAAPGSPLDPRARGANALLKEGAILVEDAADILAAISASPRPHRPVTTLPLLAAMADVADNADASLAARIAALLSPTPMHVNELARQLGAPVGAVGAAMVELELEGVAMSLPGGQVTRAMQ